jgi:hypothetical protein
MAQPKRGNWRVRQCCENIQPMIDEYTEHHSGDDETSVTDILADLMLWCYAHKVDFDSALDSARGHAAVESEPHYLEGEPQENS